MPYRAKKVPARTAVWTTIAAATALSFPAPAAAHPVGPGPDTAVQAGPVEARSPGTGKSVASLFVEAVPRSSQYAVVVRAPYHGSFSLQVTTAAGIRGGGAGRVRSGLTSVRAGAQHRGRGYCGRGAGADSVGAGVRPRGARSRGAAHGDGAGARSRLRVRADDRSAARGRCRRGRSGAVGSPSGHRVRPAGRRPEPGAGACCCRRGRGRRHDRGGTRGSGDGRRGGPGTDLGHVHPGGSGCC